MTCIINYPHGKSINIPQINIDKWYSENGDNNVFMVNKIYLGRKNSVWEWNALQFFMERLSGTPNAVILDIGAQQGLYSLLASFFPKTTWYSFEPYESSYELLNSNLQYNNITNVSTYKIGMSNIKGTDILFVPNKKGEKGGLNCLARKNDARIKLDQCEQIHIETDTIDNLFINTPINYIKIDIEGFELNVLLGGINTILKYRPFILMEYNHVNMKTCDITPNMVDNFFIKLNYNYVIIDDEERFYYPV